MFENDDFYDLHNIENIPSPVWLVEIKTCCNVTRSNDVAEYYSVLTHKLLKANEQYD